MVEVDIKMKYLPFPSPKKGNRVLLYAITQGGGTGLPRARNRRRIDFGCDDVETSSALRERPLSARPKMYNGNLVSCFTGAR